ncbi:hypothetical protein [Geobacillus thermoleovorans]|nr:hypothetical protein [Geobacillus thermoleovorans]
MSMLAVKSVLRPFSCVYAVLPLTDAGGADDKPDSDHYDSHDKNVGGK